MRGADSGLGSIRLLGFPSRGDFLFNQSEDWANIDGERTKLQAAHYKLCYSRAFIVRAYLLRTREMLFDAHGEVFWVFSGVFRRGIYDIYALPLIA